MVWLICLPLIVPYFFAGKYLVLIFLDNPTGTAMDSATAFLKIVSPFYIVVSAKLISDSILRGAGMMYKFMISTFTDLVLRVILANVLSSLFGVIGIWIAWPIGWSVSIILSILFYRTGVWFKPQKENAESGLSE